MGIPIRQRRRLLPRSVSGLCLRHGVAAAVSLAVAVGPLAMVPLAMVPTAEAAAPEPTSEDSEQDPALEQAMKAYQRGTENYNLAQYEAALADFKEAASLYASADFQYNIGLCYEKLGKYDEAIRAFATYLKAKPDAEDRPNVENKIKELQEAIEQQKQDAEAIEAARREREAEAARQRNQPPPDDGDDEPPDDGRPLILGGAALIGVGAAVALGGGLAFGALARQRSLTITDVQFEGNPEDLSFEEAQTIDDEGRRFEAIQIGMVAGGATIAVVGTVLLALGLRKRKAVETTAWLGPGGGGVAVSGRF